MRALATSGYRITSLWLAALCLLAAAGCADRGADGLTEPSIDATAQSRAADATPFYYYQGERIPLEIDATRLVVKSTGPSASDRAANVLRGLGLPVQARAETAKTGMARRRGHEILTFGRGAATAAIRAASKRLRQIDGIEFASPVYRTAVDGHEFVPLDRIMVEFESGTTKAQIDEINRVFGTRTVRAANPDSAWFFYILEFPKSMDRDPMELVAELYEHPLVKWADVDKVTERRLQGIPTDPYYGTWQYYLHNTRTRNGIHVDINVEPAWEVTKGEGIPSAGGIRVAVIDDGVDASHPDLDVSPPGYDLFGNNSLFCSDCASSPFGDDIHGTAVAGIIGAQHDGSGTAGIAPAVHIVPIRIFRGSYSPDSSQWAGEIETAEAIDFAWHLADADVINNSWGGGAPSDAITAAIDRAINSGRGGLGSVVVFSAGNTSVRSAGLYGAVEYPASLAPFRSIFSVGAIDRYGDPADYTPRSTFIVRVSLVAPSGHTTGPCIGDVVTTELRGSPGCQDGPNGDSDYTGTFSGTSAAAPQVSGAAALLLSEHPNLTAAQVIQRIRDAADDWGSSLTFGSGKLNIGRLFPPPPPEPEPCVPVPPQITCDPL